MADHPVLQALTAVLDCQEGETETHRRVEPTPG